MTGGGMLGGQWFLARGAFSRAQRAQRSYQAARYDDALPQFRDAVERFRRLHERFPDDARRFDVHVARELNNVGLCLGRLGRHEEAVGPLTEAVRTFEGLAAGDPDAWNPYMAGTLCTLASVEGDLGRHDDAIATNARVVDLRRAAVRPGAWADPELAVALRQFGHLRANAGRDLEAAKVAVTEAQTILMQLMQQAPQRYVPEMYTTLSVLALVLQAMGRHQEAQRVLASVERRDLDQLGAMLGAQRRPPGR